jgi:VanZ family protein
MNLKRHLPPWPFLLALLIALFPYGWITRFSIPFQEFMDMLFPSVRAHAIGHTSMFFFLGSAVLITFPQLRTRPILFFGLMLLAGIAQEGFQLAYKQRPIVFDDVRDLIPDMFGAALALGVIQLASTLRHVKRKDPLPME